MAQIVSALAVVLSLVYAVSELKRARALSNTDLETMLYGRMLEMDRLVAENDDLADIVFRVTSDPQSLDARERARYLAFEHIRYDSWETALEARQSGLIDPERFADWEAWFIADAERRPAIGWEGNLRFYNPAFIEYVEARVSRE